MEVHHHAHTARKKWTHYFWEFFMLFLAVFCGFLAENQREHYVEHLREKTYIRSVIKDIKTDSSRIGYVIDYNNDVIKGLDSLILILDTTIKADEAQLSKIHSLFYTWGSSPYIVIFSDRTISQLKSAGGMRLIKKQASSDLISKYYDMVDICDEQVKIYMMMMVKISELSFKFLDRLYTNKGHTDFVLAKKLYETNLSTVREFINLTADLTGTIKNYNDLIFQMNEFGTNVINTLKKDYHLK